MKKGWSEIKIHKEICVYGQTQTKLEEEELIRQREIEEQQNIAESIHSLHQLHWQLQFQGPI